MSLLSWVLRRINSLRSGVWARWLFPGRPTCFSPPPQSLFDTGGRGQGSARQAKTEHKTQYPAENRDNSYLAANQHMVKFADELRGINEQAALSFDRRKNPAEYDLKEKQEMLEAVTEAFNAANWNSAIERRLAADDIAQNLYHPMYPRLEVADAAVQHKLPDEFIQELKIEYFEQSPSKERTFYGGAKNRLQRLQKECSSTFRPEGWPPPDER